MKNEEVVMGKMNKKNLEELKRDDPKENNWELAEEQETGSKEQVCETGEVSEPVAANAENEEIEKVSAAKNEEVRMKNEEKKDVAEKRQLTEKDILDAALTQVDPEINRADNPVWKYAVKEKEVVIVFRSGQKVRVPRE